MIPNRLYSLWENNLRPLDDCDSVRIGPIQKSRFSTATLKQAIAGQ
jgi:hypothetical protein